MSATIVSWFDSKDKSIPEYEHNLYEAVAALATLNKPNEQLITKLLNAKDYHARAFAAEWVGHWSSSLENTFTLLEKAIADSSEQVRMKAIIGCAHVKDGRALKIVAMATAKKMDGSIKYAHSQAMHHLSPYKSTISFSNNTQRLAAILAESDLQKMRQDLLSLLKSKKLEKSIKQKALKALAKVATTNDLLMILTSKDSGALTELIKTVKSKGIMPESDVSTSLLNLINGESLSLKKTAIELSGLWQIKKVQSRLTSIIKDKKKPDDLES
jgi:HEAT repeat protein